MNVLESRWFSHLLNLSSLLRYCGHLQLLLSLLSYPVPVEVLMLSHSHSKQAVSVIGKRTVEIRIGKQQIWIHVYSVTCLINSAFCLWYDHDENCQTLRQQANVIVQIHACVPDY